LQRTFGSKVQRGNAANRFLSCSPAFEAERAALLSRAIALGDLPFKGKSPLQFTLKLERNSNDDAQT